MSTPMLCIGPWRQDISAGRRPKDSPGSFAAAGRLRPGPLTSSPTILVLGLLALALCCPAAEEAPKDWQNPKLTGLSNEPPHATMVICPDAATARSIRFTANSERTKS